jgi:hypothetical protein
MSAEVACQFCGALGLEDETDLMPRCCPRCFERRIAPVFGRARSLAQLIEGLVEIGCHPLRIANHIRKLAHAYGASEETCLACGKPAAYVLNGSPYCEPCYGPAFDALVAQISAGMR